MVELSSSFFLPLDMKKTLLISAASIIAILILLLSTNWSWRWLVLHGWSASKQAKLLLSGQRDTDDEFIDYIIYTMDGCVVFSPHETEGHAMAYCPKGLPSDSNKIGATTHLVGAWYTTRISKIVQ